MAEKPTILIVDDEPVNRAVLRGILERVDFRTIEAPDGPSARKFLSNDSADLVLLDVMMPHEDGFDTCSQLKSNPATVDIPVIFLSALDDVRYKVKGLQTGGVDYITKPFRNEEVLARVRVHLKISEAAQIVARERRERVEQFRTAQQAILVRPEDCPAAAFAVCYRPLEEAGGDFYDVLEIGAGVFGYFVADVSGHGVSAAFLTSAIKALLRQYEGPLYSPEETLRGVNTVMGQMLGKEQFLTACYARLHRPSRQLIVVGAGHPPLILMSPSGAAQVVELDSDPLGIFSSAVLQRRDLEIALHDRIFLYTDGLIEASGGSRTEGLRRLIEACRNHRADPLEEAVRAIVNDLRPPALAPEDDLLLLATEVVE